MLAIGTHIKRSHNSFPGNLCVQIQWILELTRRAGSTEGAMSFPGEHKMFYENDQKVTFHRITYGPSALHMAHHFKSGPPLVCFRSIFFRALTVVFTLKTRVQKLNSCKNFRVLF